MLADLHGKISSSGSNLTENLEDNLTGNFFGSLRYIPFSKGIRNILLINDKIKENDFDTDEIEEWDKNIEFWPYHKDGELDVIINLKKLTIGIEVKFNSGLSSDDAVINEKEEEKSKNQLARESRIIEEIAKSKKTKPVLLFIAKHSEGIEIINDVIKRNIIASDVELVFVSWEDMYLKLEEIYGNKNLNYYEKLIIKDLYELLMKKGFDVFKDIYCDYDKIIDKEKFYSFEVLEEISENYDGDNFSFNDEEIINEIIKKEVYYEFK